MKSVFSNLITLYHKFLGLFFDFDIGIYALETPKIPTRKITEFKEAPRVPIYELKPPKIKAKTHKLTQPVLVIYKCSNINEGIKIHNFTEELCHSIKIREEKLPFLCIARDYDLDFEHLKHIIKTKLGFITKTNKLSQKEIHISHSLRTIEEILELEPYTRKLKKSKILEIPIVKYPVKKEKFTENQLEAIKTKLAIQAKCKKYSMTLENIYDKFPVGVYDEIKVEKDSTVRCTLNKKEIPTAIELQILATGKRKYDTQTTKVFIKYSEIGLQ